MAEVLPPYYSQLQLSIVVLMFGTLVIGFIRPAWAVMAYTIAVLFRPGEVFPSLGAFRLELVIAVCLALIIVVHGRFRYLNLWSTPIIPAMMGFCLIAYLSVFQAFNMAQSWAYAYEGIFINLCLFVMILCLLDSPADVEKFLLVYLGLTLWLTYLPLFKYFNDIGHVRGQILNIAGDTGGVAGHVALANVMLQSLPFSLCLIRSGRFIALRIIGLITLALTGFTVIATGSRGGFVGLIVFVVLVVWRSEKRLKAAAVAAVLLLLVPLLSGSYVAWVSTVLDLGGSDVSAHSRLDGLRNGIEMAIRRPILGVGIGCFALARGAWFGWSIWAHNLYGELIGELGLLGVATWGALLYFCYLAIRKTKKSLAGSTDRNDRFMSGMLDACWIALGVRLAIGMFTHCLVAYIWYVIAALLAVLYRITRRQEEKQGDALDAPLS